MVRTTFRDELAELLAARATIFAKCWSEWQDLNLRTPRPERCSGPADFASAFASELPNTRPNKAIRDEGAALAKSSALVLNPCSIHVARICRYSSEMPGKQREQTATWCDMNETSQRALSVDIVTDLALAGLRWRGLATRARAALGIIPPAL